MDDPRFRAAVFEQLGSSDLEGPATTDIAGSANAHSIRLDKEATEAIRKGRLHQKVATTIFFESNGGQLKADAALGEIKAAAGGPGVNMADIDHVLDGLISSCYYLNVDRNRYRFSVTPNVNKLLTDRRAAVQPKQIDDLLRKEIESAFRVKVKDYELDVRPFPERSNDVPDRPVLTLAVLHPERQSGAAATRAFMDKVVKECGSTGRTFKGAVVFAAADAIGAMRDAARDVLAWRDIDEDGETKTRLDDGQRRQLVINVGGSRKTLEEAIWRAYRHVFLLNRESVLRQVDLGIVTRSQASSPTENLLNRLFSDDIISGAPSASKLIRWWPPALSAWPTRAVRDAFFTTPALARLRQPGLIRRTIADGASRGDIGYARKKADDKLELLAFKQSLLELDVEISDDVVILKPEDATKLLEPPRLARVQVSPDGREIAPGEVVAFSVKGLSQYGEPYEAKTPVWTVSGGTIDEMGKFRAGAEVGLFSVIAKCSAIEGAAQIRVRAHDQQKPERGTIAGAQQLLWSGEVPAQKWMNFYTKVLTRFASTPGLKLRVTFEAPLDSPDAKAKADEARAALRELGLDDHISGVP